MAVVMAESIFSHADLNAAFFSSDDWTFVVNLWLKSDFQEIGLLWLQNDGSVPTLLIGIDVDHHLYATTGQDVEGTPDTTTYTDSVDLSTYTEQWLNLSITYSHTNSLITFGVNGVTREEEATSPYDRTGTNDETITIGYEMHGYLLNLKFGPAFFLINNEGDNALSAIPDVISGHDVTIQDATWEELPT